MDFLALTLTFFRLLLSTAFLTSSLGKMGGGSRRFAVTIASFKLVPRAWAQIVAFVLIGAEVIIAFLLLIGWQSQGIAALCALLLIIFIFAVGINLIRGRKDLECGCLGPKYAQKINLRHIGLQLVLLIIAFCVMLWGGGLLSWDNQGEEILPFLLIFGGLSILFRLTWQLYRLLLQNSLEE